jgi:hypothetical protein
MPTPSRYGASRALRAVTVLVGAYGPLVPLALLFLIVAPPPLLPFSGWPLWLWLPLLLFDVAVLVGTAALLGPGRRARTWSLSVPINRL